VRPRLISLPLDTPGVRALFISRESEWGGIHRIEISARSVVCSRRPRGAVTAPPPKPEPQAKSTGIADHLPIFGMPP